MSAAGMLPATLCEGLDFGSGLHFNPIVDFGGTMAVAADAGSCPEFATVDHGGTMAVAADAGSCPEFAAVDHGETVAVVPKAGTCSRLVTETWGIACVLIGVCVSFCFPEKFNVDCLKAAVGALLEHIDT